MASIFDKIRYDNRTFFELQDPLERVGVEQLARKLKGLEEEIVKDPKGTIIITRSGNVSTTSFKKGLSDRISKTITGHL